MKKIYLSPVIETIELRFSPMMTDSLSAGSEWNKDSGSSFAPRRKTNPF